MKKILLTGLLLLPLLLNSQINYKSCQVLQTNAKDTSKQHIAHIQELNENGKLVYEKYTGYKLDYSNGKTNHEWQYQYVADRLVEKVMITKSNYDNTRSDSLKYTYKYENGLLVEASKFRYAYRTKASYVGCTPRFPEDFREASWRPIGGTLYFYNEQGQLIEEKESDPYFSKKRYTYEYDEKNRLTKRVSFNGERVIWIETTTYGLNKKTMTRLWESYTEQKSWSNPLYFKFEYDLNNKGAVVKEVCTYDKMEAKNILHSTKTYAYDAAGRLVRYVSFGKDGQAQILHEYEYR